MIPSEVRYAKSGDVHVAYQVLGSGPTDLVLGFSGVSQLEVMWEQPQCARQFQLIAGFARLILFDKRGVGLSDRNVGIATLEDRIDDIRAVMDAVESPRAWLFGTLDSTPMSILFAATYPEKTLGLILWGGQALSVRTPDYPWAKSREEWEAGILQDQSEWGSPAHIARMVGLFAPSRANDPQFHKYFGRRFRFGASPAEGAALGRMTMQVDVRSALSTIHVPTLVMYTPSSRASSVDDAKYLGGHIVGSQMVEVTCPDHLFWTTPEGTDQVVSHMRRFIEGLVGAPETDRILTTVLFTDIVGSTQRATELGDRRWGELLDRHFSAAKQEVSRSRGTLIKTTGDGMLAMFDGPTRAIRCALAIKERGREDGLRVRAGLHTGECMLRSGDVQGIAVHIASRVADLASEGEVLASGTVRDLSVGSSLKFQDRGARTLKGIEGKWRIFSVAAG